MTWNNKTEKALSGNDQSGAALVIAIFSILLVTAVAFALMSSGLISNSVAKNSRDQTVAYYVSEAGLQHAISLAKAAGYTQFTNILRAGDGVANTGDELSTQPAARTPIPAAGIAIADGYYVVYVSDDPWDGDGDPNADANGVLVIRSVGYGNDGSTVTTEAVISVTSDMNRVGLLADGNIKITGTGLTVHGPGNLIHSNGKFDTSAVACAEAYVSESSNWAMNTAKIFSGATCATPGVAGVNALSNQPLRDPEIHDIANLQSAFKPHADFIFKADGNIYRPGSAVAMTPAQITAAHLTNWTWSRTTIEWTYSNNQVMPTGTYYAEGCDMRVSNGGTSTPNVTFISEGSITYNGPNIQPKFHGWALVSANDIVMHGNLGVSGNPGMIYAYGQIQTSGKLTIYGWLQAANFRRADGTNGPDANNFGGNNLVVSSVAGAIRISSATDIYSPPYPGDPTLTMISRREVRY
jgi:Tfp pilus assembly protein PilX